MAAYGKDEKYVKESAHELWTAFRGWRTDMEEFRALESAKPLGILGSSLLSGSIMSSAEQHLSAYTEFVSAKLLNMRQNYVGRMINGHLRVESRRFTDDRAQQARMEALLHTADAILWQLDASSRRNGFGSWRRMVAESSAFPGKMVARPWVRAGPGGIAIVTCELYDPLSVAHDFDSWPRRLVHRRRMNSVQAKKVLEGLKAPGEEPYKWPAAAGWKGRDEDTVTLEQVWIEEGEDMDAPEHDVSRCILVDGHYAGSQYLGFDRLPWVVGVTHAAISAYQRLEGGEGDDPRGVTDEFIRAHARPFHYPLLHTHRQNRALMSNAIEGLTRGLLPSQQWVSEKGNYLPPPEATQPGGMFATKEHVEGKVVEQGIQNVAATVQLCMEIMQREHDELFNPVLFGDQPSGASGFSNVRRTSHARAVLHEPADSAARFVMDCLDETFHQFRRATGNLRIVTDGITPRPGMQVKDAYSKEDLPERINLNVDWTPDYGDTLESVGLAQQLVALGIPMSDVMTNVLGYTNPQELMDRWDKEQTRKHPVVMQTNVAQMFLERWLAAADAAKRARNPARKEVLTVTAGYFREQYRMIEAQMRGPAQGQGSQPGAPGFDNRVLPPPLSGVDPVGQAAAMGQPAVGMGGQGGGAQEAA